MITTSRGGGYFPRGFCILWTVGRTSVGQLACAPSPWDRPPPPPLRAPSGSCLARSRPWHTLARGVCVSAMSREASAEGDAVGRRASLGSGEYVVVGGVRHVVPYEHDFIFKVQKACSVAHALKHHVRFQGQASDRTFWVRASVERASRESVAFPLEPAPGSRSRAPAGAHRRRPADDASASFIRRDPVVPPRSPSRPPPLNLAQDAELAAGRVAVADGPMRARLPVGGDIPAEGGASPPPSTSSSPPTISACESRDTSTNPPSRPPNPRFSTRTIVWCSWINPRACRRARRGWGRASRRRTAPGAVQSPRTKPPFAQTPPAEESEPEPALADQLFAVNFRVDKPVSGVWILAKGSKRSGKKGARGGGGAGPPGGGRRAAVGGDGAKDASTRVWPIATVTDPRLERSSPLGWTSRDDSTRFARTARTRATPSSRGRAGCTTRG